MLNKCDERDHMHKIKLLDYQVDMLTNYFKLSSDAIESEVLNHYGHMMIEDLPATDFDEIMEFAQGRHLLFLKQTWINTAKELYELKEAKKNLEKAEKDITDKLKALSNNRSTTCAGFSFTCTERKGSIAYDKIPELLNLDLEQYRKASINFWTLTRATEL